MTLALILLITMSLTQIVLGVLVLFQRWEDRGVLDKLQRDVRAVLAHLDRQRQQEQETEALIGRTWIQNDQDQASVETILQKQGKARAHARTGSDPFGSSAKLAP